MYNVLGRVDAYSEPFHIFIFFSATLNKSHTKLLRCTLDTLPIERYLLTRVFLPLCVRVLFGAYSDVCICVCVYVCVYVYFFPLHEFLFWLPCHLHTSTFTHRHSIHLTVARTLFKQRTRNLYSLCIHCVRGYARAYTQLARLLY